MYKEASRQKIRFNTNRGLLSVEQIWDLPMKDLIASIKHAKEGLSKDKDDDLSFLDDTIKVDPVQQLSFDILKDVYLTKKKEAEDRRNELDKKEHNQKILSLIAEKQEGELKGKSIEELERMLK